MPVSGTIYPKDRHFKNFFQFLYSSSFFLYRTPFPHSVLSNPHPPKKNPLEVLTLSCYYVKNTHSVITFQSQLVFTYGNSWRGEEVASESLRKYQTTS